MKTIDYYDIIAELREIIVIQENIKEQYQDLRNDHTVADNYHDDLDLLIVNQKQLLLELYKIVNTHESVIKIK